MIEYNSPAFWRATLALCLGSFMVFANLYLTHPLLPMLAEEFQLDSVTASWSLTISTLTLGCSLLIFGPLSDALGRNLLMSLSMAGAMLCCFALAFVTHYAELLILRALQGFFLAGLPAIAIAYMGDEFRHKALAAAVGLYISGNTLGGIGGRLLGGFMGEWLGWQEAFLLMSLISLVCLLLFIWLLPEATHFRAQQLNPRGIIKDIHSHLRNPVLLSAYLIGGLNFFIFINQYSYATFMLADAPYSMSASLLGLLFLTYLCGTFSSSLSGKFAAWLPQPLVIALGILLLMFGSMLTLLGSVFWIIAGFCVNAFGFFLAHSSASNWVSRHATYARATASSSYLLFYYLGASTGGMYLAPFWESAGWQGVITGSIFILLITLGLSAYLYLKGNHLAATHCTE